METSLSLLTNLSVDGVDEFIDIAAAGDGRNLGNHCGIGFFGEDAVIDRRDLCQPGGEVLPDGLPAEELVAGLEGFAFASRQEGAQSPLVDQDFLVEVDVLGPDGGQEIDGLFL